MQLHESTMVFGVRFKFVCIGFVVLAFMLLFRIVVVGFYFWLLSAFI